MAFLEILNSSTGILGVILAISIPAFLIVVGVLTLLAINNLHRLPAMQQSIENIERLLKLLVECEKAKQKTDKQE